MADTVNSPTFCALPWLHSYFATDGQVTLCCIASHAQATMNVRQHKLADIFHSEHMDETRRRLLAGERIAECSACWNAEDLSGDSARTHHNKYWVEKIPDLHRRVSDSQQKPVFDKPVSVDFRFGNLCNLRCQICNGHNSTQIERDPVLSKWNNAHYLQLNGRFEGEWYESPEFEHEICEFSSDIQLITLGGGEPSISKPAQSWLKQLIDRGQAKNIELRVSTNLTNVNRRFLDIVLQFGKPKIFLSIDGFGDLNNYLRYPSRWSVVERNADYLASIVERSNLTVCITPVISAYNVLSIVKLFDWAADRGFDIMTFQVRGVDPIDCALIPDDARKLAVSRMRDFLKTPKQAVPSRQTIENICQYLEAPVDPTYAESCREKFHQFTRELDQDRKMRFEDYDPEMTDFLDYQSASPNSPENVGLFAKLISRFASIGR